MTAETQNPAMDLKAENLVWQPAGVPAPLVDVPGLHLEPGTFLALGGPSGSGKSSLLNLFAGLRKSNQGSVVWKGTDIMLLDEVRRDAWRQVNIGMVFQDFRLLEDLSLRENVLLPLSFRAWKPDPQQKKRCEDLLDWLDISPALRDHKAGRLSRGEMQRTALARALLQKPGILLADEPTASLDEANGQTVIRLLLERTRLDGTTLIMATHDRKIKSLADQVLELEHGKPVSLSGVNK